MLLTLCLPVVETALRAGPNADPPLNMHNAAIFQGVFVCVAVVTVVGLRGTQTRRKLDEQRAAEAANDMGLDIPTP